MKVLHLRVLFLLIEDLPQLFILMYYAILLYDTDGLECRECTALGSDRCMRVEGSSNRAVVLRFVPCLLLPAFHLDRAGRANHAAFCAGTA